MFAELDEKVKLICILTFDKRYTFLNQTPVFGYYANSTDPVQTPLYAASDQGLYCFLTDMTMENAVKLKTSTKNPLKLGMG